LFKLRYIALSVILILGIVLAGCSSSTRVAKSGDTVQVNYVGKLADGTVFDTSVGRRPYEFTLGAGQVIEGFDKAVVGMKVGEKKTVTIPSAEAYGPHIDSLVVHIARNKIKLDTEPAVGQVLTATSPDGKKITFVVTGVSDNGTITLDANNPLAGKDLTFDIELLKIK